MITDKEIILALGIDSLPLSKQEEVIDRIENIILTKLTSKTINKLSPEGRKKYVEILDSGNPEDIYQFLSIEVPDFKNLVTGISEDAISEFKKKLASK